MPGNIEKLARSIYTNKPFSADASSMRIPWYQKDSRFLPASYPFGSVNMRKNPPEFT